jgi:hypothetical protein
MIDTITKVLTIILAISITLLCNCQTEPTTIKGEISIYVDEEPEHEGIIVDHGDFKVKVHLYLVEENKNGRKDN